MAKTAYVECSHCKDHKLGPYTIDTSSKQVTHGNCPHCGKRYTVEYGKNEIKATKG